VIGDRFIEANRIQRQTTLVELVDRPGWAFDQCRAVRHVLLVTAPLEEFVHLVLIDLVLELLLREPHAAHPPKFPEDPLELGGLPFQVEGVARDTATGVHDGEVQVVEGGPVQPVGQQRLDGATQLAPELGERQRNLRAVRGQDIPVIPHQLLSPLPGTEIRCGDRLAGFNEREVDQTERLEV
jgi:hypothetical protein